MKIEALELIAEQIALLLRAGPMDEEELLEALDESGVDLGQYPEDLFDELYSFDGLMPLILCLEDGRYIALDAVMVGRLLTHRLTEAEISHDYLELGTDLHGATYLSEDERYTRLVDGSPFRHVVTGLDDEILAERQIGTGTFGRSLALLERGTLADYQVGDLIALGITDDGFTLARVESGELTEPPAELRERILDFVGEHEGEAGLLWEILWLLCTDDTGLFVDPTRPFGELLADSGVIVKGDAVARVGFDFEAARSARAVYALIRQYGIAPSEAFAVDALSSLHEALLTVDDDDGPAGVDAATERALAHLGAFRSPASAHALADGALMVLVEKARAQIDMVRMVLEQAPRSARPALLWVSARAHETIGETLDAEVLLGEALSVDPRWEPALYSLAGYALDRGDCRSALDLLHRAKVRFDDPLRREAELATPPGRSDLGRNKPCWCGSGRKYKVCHLGREATPLDERARWLYQKALRFAMDATMHRLRVSLLTAQWNAIDDSLLAGMAKALILDIALAEGGIFEEFVAQRSVLLPEDEASLAKRWLPSRRSVFEVESVDPGVSVKVRDVRTGDRHEVAERSASQQLREFELISSRVMPAGEEMQFFGGVERVPPHARAGLLDLLDSDPAPEELVEFFARMQAPPTFVTRAGETMELCRTRLSLPSTLAPAQAHSTLDSALGVADGKCWVWLRTEDGVEHVDGTIEPDEGDLVLEAMSRPRIDELLDEVGRLLPGVAVLEETRTAVDLNGIGDAGDAGHPEAEEDPQLQELLGQFTRDYEQRWLDMTIPVLDGLTPRQAAADPTRREDLKRLLASVDGMSDNQGAMSADRLRQKLGFGS